MKKIKNHKNSWQKAKETSKGKKKNHQIEINIITIEKKS
jgi:hypothetical protein